MIEILPNWHPFFVHFSVSLLIITFVVFSLSMMAKQYATRLLLRQFARWSLWVGTGMSVLTVAAGIYAYYTVAHDGPSHDWMTIHRNMAMITFGLYFVLAIWSFTYVKKQQEEGRGFMSILSIALVVLLTTAWLGGELVYRHGLGVMALPDVSGEGHDHGGHDHGHQHDSSTQHDDLMGGADLMEEGESHPHEHNSDQPHSHE